MHFRLTPAQTQALGGLLGDAPFRTHLRGRCMTPPFRDGSMIHVVPGARLRCGDAMLWRDDAGQLVCHRYLGRFPGRHGLQAVSWADRAVHPDQPVRPGEVLGRVTRVDGEELFIGYRQRLLSRLRYFRYCVMRLRSLRG